MYIQHVIVDCGEFGLAEKLQASWTAVVQENPILRWVYANSLFSHMFID